MMVRALALSLLGALTLAAAHAGEASGPKKGDKLGPLKVYAITGEVKDKEVDYADRRKGKPTLYLFVSAKDFDRPMFRFMKKLNEEVNGTALVVAVWLTDDADQSKAYLPKLAQYFDGAALTVFSGAAGPTGWAINPDTRLTAVVADKSRVLQSFGYQSVNETNVAEVAKVLKRAAKK